MTIDDVQTEERDENFQDDVFLRSLVDEDDSDTLLIHSLLEDDDDDDADILFHKMFSILMMNNTCPPDPPIIRFPKQFFEYSVQEMYQWFRFSHTEVYELMTHLQIPQRLKFGSHWFQGEEAFIILLRRMANVTTFRDLRQEIRRDASELCDCFNGMIMWMIENHGWLISGMVND